MTPIDFIKFDGDSNPNLPVYKWEEAMNKEIRVMTADGPATILSYYYDEKTKRMFLDIET